MNELYDEHYFYEDDYDPRMDDLYPGYEEDTILDLLEKEDEEEE